MFQDIIANKKKLTVAIVISVVTIAAIATATVLIINSTKTSKTTDKNSDKTSQTVTADSIKNQGVAAEASNDTNKAKTLYAQAKDKYEADGNTNGVVDMKTKLCILGEKAYCPPETK